MAGERKPVDVLDVMQADASDAHFMRKRSGSPHAEELKRDSAAARAAIAEFMREVDIIADALTQDGRGVGGMTKEVAAKRLRAALALVGGDA